jgi:hypothetical protein
MHEAPFLRCSDADRDRAAAVLREGLADGRISIAELDDRLDRVYRARTYGELTAVMGDLPAWAPPAGPPPYPTHRAAPPATWPLPPRPLAGLGRFGLVAALVWIVFLGMAAVGSGAGAAGVEPLLFVVAVWAFVMTFRRGIRSRRRHLPPRR